MPRALAVLFLMAATAFAQSPKPAPQLPSAPVAAKPKVVKAAPLTLKFVPGIGKTVKLTPRSAMTKRATIGRTFAFKGQVPTVTPPIDNSNGQKCSWPMDSNDVYGDCGEAMIAHCDNTFTYMCGLGIESTFADPALVNQYFAVSGGDNGLDEDMVVNQIGKVGIAGNPQAVIVDTLDFDVTNVPLTRFALSNNFLVCMAWSVPDAFLNQFATGAQFLQPGIPDPNNGHFTPLIDVDVNGNYSLVTWGSWCIVSPSYVASVQPQCFAVFSARGFNPATGFDAKGRHIATQAAQWVACGGNPVPLSVINAFPPLVPTPTPTPSPVAVGTTYTIMPSQAGSVPCGLQFGPGLDFVITNATALGGNSVALVMSFGVAFGSTDASGNTAYAPASAKYQLYLMGGSPPAPIAEAVLTGTPEVRSLGGGRYEFDSPILGTTAPGSPQTQSGTIQFLFNTNLPAGFQVQGGSISFVSP